MNFMKNLFLTAAFLITTMAAFAQPATATIEANGTKILKGFITKNELANDTSFKWFAENQMSHKPDTATVNKIRNAKDSFYILAFGGTWCGDTKHILPQVYNTLDAAGFSQDRMTLIGVDRSKKTINNLTEIFGVTNVPTFIIMKNGKEIGRVVEYGKMGMPDKEIAQIVSNSK